MVITPFVKLKAAPVVDDGSKRAPTEAAKSVWRWAYAVRHHSHTLEGVNADIIA
jgi:hypothetical protein